MTSLPNATARSIVQPKTVLVTGATGDTGRPTVRLLIEKGHRVRALAHKEDARSDKLKQLGAEIVIGDMLNLSDVRTAAKGACSTYFVYPLAEGLLEASVVFGQVAKEEGMEIIVNMSHKQSRP